MRDGVRKLDAAARDPGVIASAHIQGGIESERLPGLGDPGLARVDQPGKDQGLRARAAFDQAPVDEQLVHAKLGCAGLFGGAG